MARCRDEQSSYIEDKIYEDENGKYRRRLIFRDKPCNCHPETCCHFGGTKQVLYKEEKVYLNE